MDNLPVFPSFDYDSDKANAGPRWKRWVQRLENLFVGLKLEDGKQKKALLLHYGGERVYDIYDAEKGPEEPDYEATKKILTTYFEPKINVIMEVYSFRNCRQSDEQSLEEYVTELRQLAKTCQKSLQLLDSVDVCCSSSAGFAYVCLFKGYGLTYVVDNY